MNVKEFRTMLDVIEAKYGSNLEFFLHGPEGPEDMLSGFGTAVNHYCADIVLKDGTPLRGIFMHGLAIPKELGPNSGFPIKTLEFPVQHYLLKKEKP